MGEIVTETFASPLLTAASICRFLAYAGALVAAGGMLFVVAIHDRVDAERARLARAVIVAAIVAGGATIPGVALQGALLTGRGTGALTDPSVLAAILASPFGTSALVRVGASVAMVLAAATLWRYWSVALGLGASVAMSGSFLLTGHTVQARPGWLAIGSGLVHTLAAATWFGGLVLLAVTLRARREDAGATAEIVSRFSTVATAAVILVSVAGTARASTLISLSSAGLHSGYALVLLAKVLLVGVVLVVGGYNRRYLVPAVRAAGHGAQRRLRSTIRFEGLALLAVIAVSAVLANLSPPELAGPGPGAPQVQAAEGNSSRVQLDAGSPR